MRRKTYDVLFEPEAGMLALVKTPCLWRSAFYFILSIGFLQVLLLTVGFYLFLWPLVWLSLRQR